MADEIFFVQKVYKAGKKFNPHLTLKKTKKTMTSQDLNCSFDSPLSPVPSERWMKVVQSRVTAVVNVKDAPRKTHKLNLELNEDGEVYGTIHFAITPQRTPSCKCPGAPRPVRTKLVVKLENISRLVFDNEVELRADLEHSS